MTGERPSEQVRLEHIHGLQYIAEDRAQAEVIACAAVNYAFPQRRGRQYAPEDLRPKNVNPCSDYVHKSFYYEGDHNKEYLETNFIQRDETGPVKLIIDRQDWFTGGVRRKMVDHITAATGIDCQPPKRELRRTFGDVADFTKYLHTEASPISQDDLDSFARRRLFLALRENILYVSDKKNKKAMERYMELPEAERIELLDKTVSKAQKKKPNWDQIAIPFGYSGLPPRISDQIIYGSFTWPEIADEDISVRGMVVVGGYYDLKRHLFKPEKMNRLYDTQVIAWLAPKRPSSETTEGVFGPRLDKIAYGLGATATDEFKELYEKNHLHPKPKHFRTRFTKKRPVHLNAHQVHREIRVTPNPLKDFFGDY